MFMKAPFNSIASHDGVGERLVEASRHLGDALREAGTSVTRGTSYARSLKDEMLANSRDAARSARSIVEKRPVEAVLVAGLAAFALGWLLRRVQEAVNDDEPVAARRKAGSSRSRRRAPG